jgi:hypothetical protein
MHLTLAAASCSNSGIVFNIIYAFSLCSIITVAWFENTAERTISLPHSIDDKQCLVIKHMKAPTKALADSIEQCNIYPQTLIFYCEKTMIWLVKRKYRQVGVLGTFRPNVTLIATAHVS